MCSESNTMMSISEKRRPLLNGYHPLNFGILHWASVDSYNFDPSAWKKRVVIDRADYTVTKRRR